jgi:hypothetical protein
MTSLDLIKGIKDLSRPKSLRSATIMANKIMIIIGEKIKGAKFKNIHKENSLLKLNIVPNDKDKFKR